MHREIEIRVQIQEPSAFLAFLDRDAELVGVSVQLDIYFEPKDHPFLYETEGKELGADKWLRIRKADNCTVLCLKEVERDARGEYLCSTETEVGLSDIDAGVAILERLSFNEIIRVAKRRTEWTYREFIVAKDEIEELGVFFEIEINDDSLGVQDAIGTLIAFLDATVGVPYQRVQGGYPQLIWRVTRNSRG